MEFMVDKISLGKILFFSNSLFLASLILPRLSTMMHNLSKW